MPKQKQLSYGELCSKLYDKIGKKTWNKIANANKHFELFYSKERPEETFLGFLQVYHLGLQMLSTKARILDFGCGWAAQSYMFGDFEEYIGIEPNIKPNLRFAVSNTKHIQQTAQEFIKQNKKDDTLSSFAFCSYVPDTIAQKLIAETYPNHLIVFLDKNNQSKYDLNITNNSILEL